MKVKLNIIDIGQKDPSPAPINYFFTGKHIDSWLYSPENALKKIKTVFA